MVQAARWTSYEISRRQGRCLRCGICVEICPYGVHRWDGDRVLSDDSECVGCGLCPQGCPRGALSVRFVEGSGTDHTGSEAPAVQVPGGIQEWFEVQDRGR